MSLEKVKIFNEKKRKREIKNKSKENEDHLDKYDRLLNAKKKRKIQQKF